MDILSIIIIAIGLAIDTFTVSVTIGISVDDIKKRHILKAALYFSVFQAMMPVLGWLAGFGLKTYIVEFDHWIAFILLSALGLKMIWEARNPDSEADNNQLLRSHSLVIMAIATSIDALVVGVSFALLDVEIINPMFIIGGVTFFVSILGIYVGKALGKKMNAGMNVFGGIILIAMGTKILLEHLF